MNRLYSRNDNLVVRRIAGETFLVPVVASAAQLDSIYIMNEIGTMIWGLIERRTSLDEITEAVVTEYDVAPEVAADSIVQFLADLCAAGLIVLIES